MFVCLFFSSSLEVGKPGLTVPAFFWRIPLAETDPLPDEMNHSTTKVGSETSEPLRYIR